MKTAVLSMIMLVFGLSSCQAQNTKKEIKESSKAMQAQTNTNYKRAIFASGCFWGTEFYLQKAEGVISTTVGYTGGHVENPTYQQVCAKNTGHYEAVEVVFDPEIISYNDLVKLFFETHDPEQKNGQGPDIGPQYRSAIFYLDDEQKAIATKLIAVLNAKGYQVATQLIPATTFWPAELYHQDYYDNKGGTPYCHAYKKKF